VGRSALDPSVGVIGGCSRISLIFDIRGGRNSVDYLLIQVRVTSLHRVVVHWLAPPIERPS
jgi:hypothetical protein